MKFFKPEDFKDICDTNEWCRELSEISNAKLEREGKPMQVMDQGAGQMYASNSDDLEQKLAIAVEALERAQTLKFANTAEDWLAIYDNDIKNIREALAKIKGEK